MLLTDYLKRSVERVPEQPAVICHDRPLSYRELDLFSDVLAARLAVAGLGWGERAVLLAENSFEYVIAYFAVLKTGAAVVPLNIQMVPRELAALIDDCAPRLVLADGKRMAAAESILGGRKGLPLVEVDAGTLALCAAFGPAPQPPVLSGDDLAAIIYTSGTTGTPKGVMLSHNNLCANAEAIVQYLGLTGDDRVMVVIPFYYSYGTSLLTTHVKAGATLVIDNRFLYPNLVLDAMERHGVTGFAGVPSNYALLLRKSNLRQYRLPSLRYVTQAGGAMSPAMIREFLEIVPHAKFFVMYGQTEAAARLSYLPPERVFDKTGSIGRAIPGVELEVVDEQGRPVAPGVIGEITVRGRNVMRGYWNAPEETAAVLRDGRLHTGDLATVDEEGYLYVVSRKRDMIKSGAHRISPREIEDVVCRMPQLLECAAVGVPDEILGEAVKLFVVPAEGAALSEREVLLFCRENLASYKMPKAVAIVAALPKTASGKVKREELKKLSEAKQYAYAGA